MNIQEKINTYTVFGSGAWGTALANMIASNYGEVILYSRNENQVYNINYFHQNETYLPGIVLSNKITATCNLETATKSDIWLIVIPCQKLREFLQSLRPYHTTQTIIVCSKGVEYTSLKFPTEMIKEEFGEIDTGILSGPNFAAEVAKFIPSSSVLALKNLKLAQTISNDFSNKSFHLYVTNDSIGVEIGGATKNIIALACGISAGIGFGNNTTASFIARGLSEITNFAVRKGGKTETLNGIAGLGDLVLSCTSEASRNFKFGVQLGKGCDVKELLKENATIEGYYSTKAIYELSQQLNVEMPITECVYNILYKGFKTKNAIDLLLSKLPMKEFN